MSSGSSRCVVMCASEEACSSRHVHFHGAGSLDAAARERWAVLDAFLTADGPYHLGDRFSLLDLHMALWVNYGLGSPRDLADEFPAVGGCFARVMARPKPAALLDGAMEQLAAWRKAKNREAE